MTKPVSAMPSGPRMCLRKYTSSRSPLIVSTMRPTQSILVPYCQRVPGSNIPLVDDPGVGRGHRDDPGHLPGRSCVTERRVDLSQRRGGGLLDLFAGESAAGAINKVGGRQPTRRFQKVSTAGVLSPTLE